MVANLNPRLAEFKESMKVLNHATITCTNDIQPIKSGISLDDNFQEIQSIQKYKSEDEKKRKQEEIKQEQQDLNNTGKTIFIYI